LESNFPSIENIGLEAIYDFIENGQASNAPAGVADYLEAMDMVRGMHLRIDRYGSKTAIVEHLIKVNGLSYYLANKLYNQTVEYFYCDTEISKTAWLIKIAEGLEKDINLARNLAEDTSDLSKISNMWGKLKDVITEAFPEDLGFEDELTARPIKIYTMTPEDAGLPSVNRRELSTLIDEIPDVSELIKERLKVEARILPGNFLLEDHNNPRKQ